MALQSAEAAEPVSTSVPWVYFGSLVFLLSGAVFYLVLARVLPTYDVGAIVILAAIATIMAVVFSLGIGPGFQHFLSFHMGRSEFGVVRTLVRSAFFFVMVLSIASALATLLLSTIFSDLFFHTGAYAPAIEILAVYSGLMTGNSALQSVLLGLQRFVAYSVVLIVSSLASYGLALGLLLLWTGVDAIVVGWALGAGLGCGLAVTAIVRTSRARYGGTVWIGEAGNPNLRRDVMAYSLPLFVWSILATGATYVDRLVLASVANLASVGIYNYALLIAAGSMVVVGPFSTILVSKGSKLFGQQNREEIRAMTRGATTLIALVYLPLGLGGAALGPLLLRYLVGPGFVSASLPLIVLLVISGVFIPSTILNSVAASTRRTLAFAKAAVFAMIANVVLSILLVPRLGMLGAAIGNSSMVWVPFTVFYLELRGTGFIAFDTVSLTRIWLASASMGLLMGVPLWILNYSPPVVPVVVGAGIVYLAVMLRLLEAISNETAATLIRLLPRWLSPLRHVIYWLAPEYRGHAAPPTGGPGLTLSR